LNLNFELVENKERLAAFLCDKINILYDVMNKIIAGLIFGALFCICLHGKLMA